MIVGGGGPGGAGSNNASWVSGGGGAGQFLNLRNVLLVRGITYSVTVGGAGSPSSLDWLTAAQGGTGGSGNQTGTSVASPTVFGTSSGGAGGAIQGNAVNVGGGFASVISSGNLYRLGLNFSLANRGLPGINAGTGSGGGGAGGSGLGSPAPGSGFISAFDGTARLYCVGGSGFLSGATPASGPANTGNAGAGGGHNPLIPNGLGGSGVVMLKVHKTQVPYSVTGTYTATAVGDTVVYRWTGSGTITF